MTVTQRSINCKRLSVFIKNRPRSSFGELDDEDRKGVCKRKKGTPGGGEAVVMVAEEAERTTASTAFLGTYHLTQKKCKHMQASQDFDSSSKHTDSFRISQKITD